MLVLRVPRPEEFWIRRAWLADPDMMSFNADWNVAYPGYERATGCIDWPETEWPAFQARLARPASEQGYFYVEDTATGERLGHVHYVLDQDLTAHIGLNVIPIRRGQGLGPKLLHLLLDRVWADTRAREAVNEFEDARLAAVKTHRRMGFIPDPETSSAFGRPTRAWRLPRETDFIA